MTINPAQTRVAFMGTPAFALPTLEALLKTGYDVVAVYSQPPRPTGRGHKVQPSPVHAFAESRGIRVFTPTSLRNEEEQERFRALNLDVAVVVAYGLILPPPILEAPYYGCVNVHGSLLPRWRGAAPLQRAIEAGDTETGITIMQMDVGLDTGPMLSKGSVPITRETTSATLHDPMAQLGAALLVETLPGFMDGSIPPVTQPQEGVTYAEKLSKDESVLNWALPAETLDRRVRAFSPWPGTFFEHNGERIKVLAAEVELSEGAPGTLLDDHLLVACGEGALRLTILQRTGKGALDAEAFLRGFPFLQGTTL